MKQYFALVLAVAGSAASAQTPTTNPMPDGSRDMYVGLGAVSAPRYEGADSRKVSVLPVLQVQWSNGVFISGASAGMHLSSRPTLEFGPLLSLHRSRSESGLGGTLDPLKMDALPVSVTGNNYARSGNRLEGMRDIGVRLEGGAFVNTYLAPEWRLTSAALYGAGRDHNGARLELGVQRLATEIAPHHTVSVNAGATFVNGAYNRSYFGVTQAEAFNSGNRVYTPDGGLKDVRIGARWNWTLSPSWILTTNVQAYRLMGDARRSPLVERSTNLTVSTALAYRF